jgi:YVTN family beta-propeller protein
MHHQNTFAHVISFRGAAALRAGALCGLLLACAAACHAQAGSGAPPGRLITSMGVAVNSATHKAYAVDESDGNVMVMDSAGTTRSVKVGDNPIALAIDRKANKIYVANTGSGSISVIDGASDHVVATIPGEAHPYAIAANDITGTIYVTNTYSDAVTVIDVHTDKAHPLNVGGADGIAIDSRTNTIFLTHYEDPELRIVDGVTGAVRKVRVGAHIWGMVFDEGSGSLYLAHTVTAEIVSVNEKTLAVHTIPVGQIPCALAVNPATQRLYSVNYGDETLSVIDLRAQRAIATLPVGHHPQAVAVDATPNVIYVANVHGNSVTAIDGRNNRVIGTLAAGEHPYAVAVDAETGKAFTASYGSPALTEVKVAHRADNGTH